MFWHPFAATGNFLVQISSILGKFFGILWQLLEALALEAEAPMANFFRRISAKILRISENFFQKFYVKKRVITTFSTKKRVNATFATKKRVIAALTNSQHK